MSLLTKLQRVSGLTSGDLSPWEQKFLSNIETWIIKAKMGQAGFLSEKQLEVIDRLFEKHFAG